MLALGLWLAVAGLESLELRGPVVVVSERADGLDRDLRSNRSFLLVAVKRGVDHPRTGLIHLGQIEHSDRTFTARGVFDVLLEGILFATH